MGDAQVRIMLNDGEGGFGSPIDSGYNLPNELAGIVPGDFDRDGHQDLIFARTRFGEVDRVGILFGGGDGTFPNFRQVEVPDGPSAATSPFTR